MKRCVALMLVAALAMSCALASPAAAAPPRDFRVVRLQSPKATIAFPKEWTVAVGPRSVLRADRKRVAKLHPEQLAAFDAEAAKKHNKTDVLVAGPPTDGVGAIIRWYRPSSASVRMFNHPTPSQQRSLRKAGWRRAKIDRHRGYRLDRFVTSDDGTQSAYITAGMLMSHGRMAEVVVQNQGPTKDPVNDRVLKSFHIS